VFDSFTNTPALEPSADSDSDSDSDFEDDDGDDVQYVYIPADSPFHRSLSTPRSSTYTSFTGFPFACDALAEEDPLFVKTPGAWFDEELQSVSGDDADSGIVVWDDELSETHPQLCLNWPSTGIKDAHLFAGHAGRSPVIFDDDVRFLFVVLEFTPLLLFLDRHCERRHSLVIIVLGILDAVPLYEACRCRDI